MTVSVTTRRAQQPSRHVVVLQPQDGPEIVLEASDAFDLQRRILSAVSGLTRTARADVAKAKAREVRRAAKVDEQLREREG